MKYYTLCLILITTSTYCVSDFRKHYGLSYNECGSVTKTFKCMTVCKSIGYQLFRLNRSCKCTCHEMKTSTILPFFKWRTNGTTMKIPKLFSPQLYHVVGTLSPPPTDTSTISETTTKSPCPTYTTTMNSTTKSGVTTTESDNLQNPTDLNEITTMNDASDDPLSTTDIDKSGQTGNDKDAEMTTENK